MPLGRRELATENPPPPRNPVSEAGGPAMVEVPASVGNPGEMTDEIVETVPARYNTQSTPEREAKPGNNTLDHELTTR